VANECQAKQQRTPLISKTPPNTKYIIISDDGEKSRGQQEGRRGQEPDGVGDDAALQSMTLTRPTGRPLALLRCLGTFKIIIIV